MLKERLIRTIIKKIIESQKIKLRTSKGYSASHPVISKKPFMTGLGNSEHEPEIKKNKNLKKKPIKISKAFDENELEEYAAILEELINEK